MKNLLSNLRVSKWTEALNLYRYPNITTPLFLIVFISLDGWGQSDDPKPALTPIVVEEHYGNSVGVSETASEGVVQGRLIQDIPILRPGEVLETVPGLVVTQHSGDGKANQYFLRGYNLDHGTDLAISVNGVPSNMPSHAHGQGYADLNYLIPELVSDIRYRKGPYAAENGDFSAAGSADIHYQRGLNQGFASATMGSYGYQRLLAADSTTFNASDLTLLGAVEVQHSDGPWTSPEGLKKLNTLLRLSGGDQGEGWTLDAIHYTAHWNSTDQVPLSLIQSGALGRFSALDPTDGGNTGRDILSMEWHSLDDEGGSSLSAYLQHYRLQLWSDFTFYEKQGKGAPNSTLPSDQFEQVENRTIQGLHFAHHWNQFWGEFKSSSEVGAQLRHDNINVGLLQTQSRIPFNNVTSDLISETSAGAYFKNTLYWNTWARTVVGVRQDWVGMNMHSNIVTQNSGSASDQKLSPKFSLILGPWEKTELFLSEGHGFHSNDARGVIDKINPSDLSPTTRVPALVAAEGKEIGMRTLAFSGLESSIVVWTLESNSELVYTADSGTTDPKGSSKRLGVEWNNHYSFMHWLLIDADFAWTHARYAQMNANGGTGNYIPNAIPRVARIGVTAHPIQGWAGSLEFRYFSDYPLTQDGSLQAPSSVVTNLRLQNQIAPNITLALDALNLFDRQYFDIAYGQDYQASPTATIVNQGVTIHPGEPRTFRLTLKLSI